MKAFTLAAAAVLAVAGPSAAIAGVTGITGGGQPFDNFQPSLAVAEVLPVNGLSPGTGENGMAAGDTLGFVYGFGGSFMPGGNPAAQGQSLSVANDAALFGAIGNVYGGDGVTTFAVPNLQGQATIGAGTGPGLTTQTLGAATGSPTVTLSTSQIPPHDHTLPGGGVTGTTGGGQPFDNLQPSLPLQPMIAVNAPFPTRGSGGAAHAAFLGEVADFAGSSTPAGWLPADGRLLPINQNTALFAVLGTTYGGDGVNTFGLPDLRGRAAVGADAANPLGTEFGQESTTLTVAQMPAHDHTLPGGGVTGSSGGGQPVGTDQPSLALNYLIATDPAQDIFPPDTGGGGFDPDSPTLGQIVAFAGNFAPTGWTLAGGQQLSIVQNTALFSLLGFQYGGDGKTTFALPDLQGRTLLGTGLGDSVDYVPGETVGADATTLTVANLPPHDHALPSPQPAVSERAGLALLGLGLAATLTARQVSGGG